MAAIGERAMAFPPAIDPATGRFAEVSAGERVRQSIELILCTQKGERQLNPKFGSNLKEYPFAEANRTELSLMERDIRSCLLALEPEIEDLRLSSRWEENGIAVTVGYRMRGEDRQDTVTVPLLSMGDVYERKDK